VAVAAQREEPKPADEVSFAFGQVVRAHFFLKNTGKDSLEVSYPRLIGPSYYRSLRLLDKGGEQLPVRHKDQPAVPAGWVGIRLPGGGQAETAGGLLSIGEGADKDSADAVLTGKAGEAYSVQYTLPNYGDAKAGDLKTGEFRFRVLKKGEPESERPPAGEGQKHITWGKPGKNGLQVGVLIVPLEQRDGDRTK
jgi:hypothetical protein